jgi:hypothetical protein
MYIAAAVCLWFLKAWKVGELERIAAAEHRPVSQLDPVAAVDAPESEGTGAPQTTYLNRLFRWRKV